MSDPLTAGAIASLVFTTTLGKVVETLTPEATKAIRTKVSKLRGLLIQRFQGKPKAEEALEKAHSGSEAEVQKVASYLEVAMDEDEEFAQQLRSLAQEIEEIKVAQSQSKNVQNVYGDITNQSNDLEGIESNAPFLQGFTGQNIVNINYSP